MNFNGDLNSIISKLHKQRFTNELEHLNTEDVTQVARLIPGITESIKAERINDLNLIINKLQEQNNKNVVPKKLTHYEEIDSYMYNKPWKNLQPYHKVVKMKEYLDKYFTDEELKSDLLQELSDLIHSKKLNQAKHLTYDPNNQRILCLKVLQPAKNKKGYILVL